MPLPYAAAMCRCMTRPLQPTTSEIGDHGEDSGHSCGRVDPQTASPARPECLPWLGGAFDVVTARTSYQRTNALGPQERTRRPQGGTSWLLDALTHHVSLGLASTVTWIIWKITPDHTRRVGNPALGRPGLLLGNGRGFHHPATQCFDSDRFPFVPPMWATIGYVLLCRRDP